MRFSFVLDWPNDSLLFDSYRSYLTHTAACPISQALSLLELLFLSAFGPRHFVSVEGAGKWLIIPGWSDPALTLAALCHTKRPVRGEALFTAADTGRQLRPPVYTLSLFSRFSLFLNLFMGTQWEITVWGELTVSGPFVQSKYRFVTSHRTTVYSILRL